MSRAQHWEALDRANEVRYAQAELRREIAEIKPMSAGCYALADSLELSDPTAPGYADYLRNVTCLRYLKWGHGIGVQRANAILRDAIVGPHRTLSSLTDRERKSLARALHDAAELTPPKKKDSLTWAEGVVEEVSNA
jgi:hypothetical protein